MCAKKQKRTLLSEECPQRAVRNKRLTATSTSPEVLQSGADVSRLLAPGRPTHLPGCSCSQWRYESTITARYSGGGAPAVHPVSWRPPPPQCFWERFFRPRPRPAPGRPTPPRPPPTKQGSRGERT